MIVHTCHSSVKVVEFRGANLVTVGAGIAGKGKERANILTHKVLHMWLLTIEIILALNGLSMHLYASPAHWGHVISLPVRASVIA